MNLKVLMQMMDLFYKKYLIPIVIVTKDFEAVYPKAVWDPKLMIQRYGIEQPTDNVKLISNFAFMFASFAFSDDQNKTYYLLIGPCGIIGTPQTKLSFDGHDYHYGIHFTKEDSHSFEEFVQLIYSTITHRFLSKEQLHWYYDEYASKKYLTEQTLEDNLYERRMQESTFDSYQFELRYMEYVKRNEPQKIEWLFKKMSGTYRVNLSPDELEGLKLKFSGLVTILTRISIDQGVPINQSFSLSDALLQGLRRIHSPSELLTYMKEATYRFINVMDLFSLEEKSMLVKKVINYIDGHIYEKITLDDLAENVEKHKTHLSAQFKKEMGQTIHAYIQERKITEAKHLLLFTDRSFKEISILLSFASQSHFIQIFKQIVDCTPKEYKDQHYTYSIH